MGMRSSIWLLALLLLVMLQHALIAAMPLRGPSSKAAKPRFFRVKEHVSRMLGRGAGPTKPSSPSPEEDKDEDEFEKSYQAELDAERAESRRLLDAELAETVRFWAERGDKKNEDSKKLDKSLHHFFKPSPTRVFKSMLSGAFTAIPGCLALFPFDTIKTRLQAANSEQLLTSGNLFHSLYDGLGPALVCAAFLGAYRNVRFYLPSMVYSPIIRLFTEFLVRVPFEVVKQRRQAGLDETWEAAVSSLMTSRGLTGFFMGWAAMALRDLPVYISRRLLTESDKSMFRLLKPLKDKGVWPTGKGGQPLGIFKVMRQLEKLIPVLVALLMMPMDVVMTRLMTQSATGQYKGLFHCLLTIVKDEGLTALFRGIGPRFITLVLGPDAKICSEIDTTLREPLHRRSSSFSSSRGV